MANKNLLAEGNIFGDDEKDEFTITVDGQRQGIFKKFEYLSLPFSIIGERKTYRRLQARAQKEGLSFARVLSEDSQAQDLVNLFFREMHAKPVLSRQILDFSLPQMYITDNIISEIDVDPALESLTAKIVVAWQKLADFYCVEGLLGGSGINNPFTQGRSSSLCAGSLDSLEVILPVLKQETPPQEWTKICLQLSAVIGRGYQQIDRAVQVLSAVFGINSTFTPEEINQAKALVNELSKLKLETNVDIGKFYNTFIRFHNWLPRALAANGPSGDTYDSICIPAKLACEIHLDKQSSLANELQRITDATSPKGLAIARLIDEGRLGDREKLEREIQMMNQRIGLEEQSGESKYNVLSLDDPVFYAGLVGGKWRGLKLLHDAQKALDLKYNVPRGFVITSVETSRLLKENGILEILNRDIYTLDEIRRKIITEKIEQIQIDQKSLQKTEELSDRLIVRSSMYGEDGGSNFSGTYVSVPADKKGLAEAIKEVMASYFSQEAVQSREDIGLAHLPGISVIIQEKIAGPGGVIHIIDNKCTLSYGESPQHAVDGNGITQVSADLNEIVKYTPLRRITSDLYTLHHLFGDYDAEFVVDDKEEVYLLQFRPKLKVIGSPGSKLPGEHITIQRLDELENLSLTAKSAVRMEFLGRENMMDRVSSIMNFIRRNRAFIVEIEGYMPCVAHIPNKIEGHFGIPYKTIEEV